MHMKKVLIVMLAVVCLGLLVTGCTPSQQASTDTIKLGVNMELSGAVASYGQSTLDGIELAVEEINAAGGVEGKTVELIKYDNKSAADEATTLATKLMTQDGVVAILGPATTGAFKAEIPVANDNKIPVISGSATADDVTVDASGVKEYAFRICYSDSYQGTAMAKFAKDDLLVENAVVLMDTSNDYSKGLAKSFGDTFKADGGTIVAQESFVTGETDFNAVITKIKDKDFDAIFVAGYYQEAGLIIKQARAQGIDVPILGADGFDSPTLVELSGTEAASDIYFSNHYSSLDEDPVVQDFIEAFKDKYGKAPDAFNALGYDLAKFACDAIGRADDVSGEAIKNALASTTDYKGVTGTFSIDENHNAKKALVVIEMQNGEQANSTRAGL
jgi:branched-chain amino acid transport system substrate-binding protein